MPKAKLVFGLLVIFAVLTAGCTGTKTMIGSGQAPSAGQLAAKDDYTKSARELSDEINFMTNHYPLSPNATMDEYKAWLDGFGEKLALCRMMYNNTSAASLKYLGYLDDSSDEYRNVTAADSAYARDIEGLNQTYWNHSAYLNTSIKKMAALQAYSDKMNSTAAAYNDLSGLAKDAKIDSLDAYAKYIDSFKNKADAYEACARAAIAAGEEYAGYCEPGTAEYDAAQKNNDALKEGIKQCRDTYSNYKRDYDSKAGAQSAAQSTFKDYADKVGKASALKKEVDDYRGTAKAMDKLDIGWLDGYRQRIDAFNVAGDDAIAAGNECKKYLDPSGSDYKSVSDNEKSIKDGMAAYSDNYGKLYAAYRNLHPLGPIN